MKREKSLRNLIKPDKREAFDKMLPTVQEFFATQDDWLIDPGPIKSWMDDVSDQQYLRELAWARGPFLTVEEAAQILGVDSETVIEWIKEEDPFCAWPYEKGVYKFPRDLFLESFHDIEYDRREKIVESWWFNR